MGYTFSLCYSCAAARLHAWGPSATLLRFRGATPSSVRCKCTTTRTFDHHAHGRLFFTELCTPCAALAPAS